MGKFLEFEKQRQAIYKLESPHINNEARKDGFYKGKERPFCLPREYAIENLFPEIRSDAVSFFTQQGINY